MPAFYRSVLHFFRSLSSLSVIAGPALFHSSGLAQDSLHVSRIAHLSIPWDTVGVIAQSEDLLYVPTRTTGLFIMDVSDRSIPQQVGWIEFESPEVLHAAAVRDSLLFIGSANHNDGTGYLSIWSLADPDRPEFLSRLSFPDYDAVVDLDFYGNSCYFSTRIHGCPIVDFTDPRNPDWYLQVLPDYALLSTKIVDEVIYFTCESVFIVYNAAPTPNAVPLTTNHENWFHTDFVVDDHTGYLSSTRNGLVLFDLTTPSSPVPMGVEAQDTDLISLATEPGMVYGISSSQGLRVYDVTYPAQPALYGWHSLEPGVWKVESLGNGDIAVFCATGFDLFRAGAETIAEERPDELPELFAIRSITPNPFNPVTRITVDVVRSTALTIEVFDTIGRQVSRQRHNVTGPGTETVSFDGSRLTSGVYMLQIETDTGETASRKLILQK